MLTTPYGFNFSRACCALTLVLTTVLTTLVCTDSVDAGIVSFSDIVQTTQTPGDPANLFGVADTSTPNKLAFNHPNSFAATATGVGGVDVTDGFLTFSVEADPGTWATGISLMESGSWSLIPSLPGNSVGVRGGGTIRVTEVDDAPVVGPPINFPISFAVDRDMSDTPPDSGLWDGGFAQGFGTVPGKVTAFTVEINNRLFALSEAGFSFIDKKNIMFNVQTDMIPEPASLALIALGMVGMLANRRSH